LETVIRATPVLLIVFLALTGCLRTPPTAIPIPSLRSPTAPNDSLIIMLPGRGDRAEAFRDAGFLDTADQWGFDTLAVDAHFGYYAERTLIPRLHKDIVEPARAAGYRNIWLLGVSMGGFGSLLYADSHPLEIDGIILLAPFLGDRGLANVITSVGGLETWSGRSEGFSEYELRIWRWLKNATTSASRTPVILGYGHSDRLADAYGPLVDALDSTNVYTLDGGHRWTTWIPLWNQIAAELNL